MEFSREAFDLLVSRNSILENKEKTVTEYSNVNRLNETQEIAQIGSWTWDILENEIIWSKMMYKLIGVDPYSSTPSYELALSHVHQDDKVAYEDSLKVALDSKEDYYFENRIVKIDQSVIHVISRGSCICNDDGELIRMSGTVQDVTRYRKLIETNLQLEQFANILSHDFKAPIRTIVSFIGLIRRKSFANLTDDGKKYFTFVEESAKNLSDLVTDILKFSKLNSPELNLSTLPIKGIIDDVIFSLRIPLKEKKGTIQIGWLPEFVDIDIIKIRQVFQNLIANAIKYTSKNVPPIIKVYCIEGDLDFCFYVEDNGLGIDSKHFTRIFDPFVRLGDTTLFSGTGIGLSICKKIIDLHKGKIGCFSNELSGTSFFFSIPKIANKSE